MVINKLYQENQYNVSDAEFHVAAFTEYVSSRAAAYAEVISLCSQLQDIWEDEDMYPDVPPSLAYIRQFIRDNSSLHPDSRLMYKQGTYIILLDLLSRIASDAHRDERTGIPTYDCATGKYINWEDDRYLPIRYSEDVISWLIDQQVSVLGLGAALRASRESSLADAIAAFDNIVGQAVDLSSSAASQVSYWKDTLLAVRNPAVIMQQVIDQAGVEKIIVNPSAAIESFDISQYSGASPVGPLNFSGVAQAAGAIATTGLKILANIATAAKSLINRGVKKVVETINRVVVNPDDLERISSEATIDDASIALVHHTYSLPANATLQYRFTARADVLRAEALSEAYHDLITSTFQEGMSTLPSNTFYIRFPFGLLAITAPATLDLKVTPTFTGGQEPGFATLDLQIQVTSSSSDRPSLVARWYPFVLNPKLAMGVIDPANVNPEVTTAILQNDGGAGLMRLAQYAGAGSGLWNLNGLGEADKARGLFLSNELFTYLGVKLLGSEYNMISPWNDVAYPEGRTVTNRDFINLAYSNKVINPSGTSPSEDAVLGMFLLFILQRGERALYPTEYTFVPYAQDASWEPTPGWRIKTDADNAQLFNTVATTAVLVVAAAVTVAAAGAVVRKIKIDRAFKRQSTLNTLNAKLASGASLTPQEKRQYRRAVRRGGIYDVINSKTGDAVLPPVVGQTDSLGVIYSALTGSPISDVV